MNDAEEKCGRLPRAYSPVDLLSMKIPRYDFEGRWEALVGRPAAGGTWIIWGSPGNGKTSFVMQLAKYLCRFGRVVYDSLEEGTSLSVQTSMRRHGMLEVSRRFTLLDREPIEVLSLRLDRHKSPGVAIIDSLQYSGLTYKGYQLLKERHRGKLLIFVSHAEGLRPGGRVGKSVEYDADVKIYVSGFTAHCKSRFLERPGVPYVIWEEGAARFDLGTAPGLHPSMEDQDKE